jgi:putative ABC transport system ATP-binding protein
MIKLESVSLSHNHKEIFSDLNLLVKTDEKVLIQGKSGIGKTSLFKILLGFEPISKGLVTFNGLKINKANIKDIRQQIFYLSQDIDLKPEKVSLLLEEIFFYNREQNLPEKKLNDLLAYLDLTHNILEQNVKNLSGGERQRIGLLIGFLLDRPVWLLDEPTSALDDNMKTKIAQYILGQDKTIVIISHDDVWKKNESMRIERWV